MEIVVGLIIVAIVLFWLANRSSRRRKQEQNKSSGPAPGPAPAPAAPDAPQSAPTPVAAQGTVTLRTFELWGSRRPDFEVVGEAYRRDAFRKIYKKRSLAPGQEFYGEAVLIPERGNVHDANAVRVDVDDVAVGYLPREDAARYRPILDDLFERGRVAVTPVRVWATNADGTWRARVTIALGDPGEIVPVNEPPGGDVVEIPPNSRTVQVTGEEQHADVLAPYARGERTSVWVSLHGIDKPGSRSGQRVVEVRIDGQRCGALSPVTSSDLLPVIDRLEASGKLAVAHASVRGNSLKADVCFDVMKAGDLTEDWIADNLN
ncbi:MULTISPECIES: HIRAN domain-containing protein [unclassified Isoptericola]|uniref:HIRAN domain-containing protein n=1 Tax=unclassified Isoptericola TaxID=2623355 RepID=UPI00364BAEA3